MRILFNNETFESRHYGGVNKYYGILLNTLHDSHKVLQPTYIRNPFINKDKFSESIFLQNEVFYKDGRLLKYLNFIKNSPLFKKLSNHLLHKNKKLLLRRIKKNDFDILHLDSCVTPSNKIISYITKNVSKPIVVTVHDVIINHVLPSNKDYLAKANLPENQANLLKIASKIVAISHRTKADLVNFFNIAEEKIVVIHNCYEKVEPLFAASETYLPKKYILYVGKRHDHKNFSLFLNAIRKMLLEDEELRLVITLEGFSDRERSYFTALGIADFCIFIDASSEKVLAFLYKNALCCAVPSLYEGFGMITLEAMNYECPVAVSDIEIMHEIAGDAAIYFDPLEQSSIYEAIKKVIYDQDLRQKMIAAGLERSKNFSSEKMIGSLEKTYASLLETDKVKTQK